MWWITRGRDRLYDGFLSGGLLPEGEGTMDEEETQIGKRKDELCVATIESVETGWSFLKGLRSLEEISLVGPNLIPVDFDLGDFLSRTLDILGALNKWCEQCGGRFTTIYPDYTGGSC